MSRGDLHPSRFTVVRLALRAASVLHEPPEDRIGTYGAAEHKIGQEPPVVRRDMRGQPRQVPLHPRPQVAQPAVAYLTTDSVDEYFCAAIDETQGGHTGH